MTANTAGPFSPAPTHWTVVALTIAAGVVTAFQLGKVAVALGDLRVDLGFGLVVAGWVISIFNLIGVAGGMPAASIVGRFGDLRSAVGGLVAIGIGSLAGAFAIDATTLLVSRFFEGIGALMLLIAGPSLVQRHTAPANQKLAFGIWASYMGVGQAVMMLLAPMILAVTGGWRGLWLFNSALLLLVALALGLAARAASVPPPPRRSIAIGPLLQDVRDTMRAPGPIALAICFGTYACNYLVIVGFLPTIFTELNLSAETAASLTAFAALANGVGNIAGGALMQRGIARWMLLTVSHLVVAVLSFAIFSDALTVELRVAACMVAMGVAGVLPGSIISGIALHAPKPHLGPMTNGLIIHGVSLGQVVGPPSAAAVATVTGGWVWSPLVLVTSAAIGLGTVWWIRSLERNKIR